MRKVEFSIDAAQLTVRVEGVLITGAVLDLTAISLAKKNHSWTPILQETYFKRIESRLRNAGCREDEISIIMSKFKKEVKEV